MSLFCIADPHLSFGCNKPMDIFKGWENYTDKLKENWNSIVTDKDTVVIAGDISWAMKLNELKPDFDFIENLNGKKILSKGNHDYWWETIKKLNNFVNENDYKTISFLHNNAFLINSTAICGTRGWILENKNPSENDIKIISREACRLEASVLQARKLSDSIVAFLHYPPVYDNYECESILKILNDYNIKRCYYGHIHGKAAQYSVCGEYKNIDFNIISCDQVNFTPILVEL